MTIKFISLFAALTACSLAATEFTTEALNWGSQAQVIQLPPPPPLSLLIEWHA